jgi:hypothetical protein
VELRSTRLEDEVANYDSGGKNCCECVYDRDEALEEGFRGGMGLSVC